MKNIKVTINITFDDEPSIPNGSLINQSSYPPKSGFNFLSSTTKEAWTDFTDKKIAAGRKNAISTNIIAFPSCELLRKNHVNFVKDT